MNIGLIYKATCKETGKSYIGQTTKNLQERIFGHKYKTFYKKENRFIYNNKFYTAIRKYGFSNFEWEILLDQIPICLLNDLEVEYIKQYNSFTDGYNCSEGGDYNPMNYEENRNKISSVKKGKPGHVAWNKGKKGLQTAWNKGMTGFVPWNRGITHSDETKARLSKNHHNVNGKNNPMFGRKHSEETKRKMSEARRNAQKEKK